MTTRSLGSYLEPINKIIGRRATRREKIKEPEVSLILEFQAYFATGTVQLQVFMLLLRATPCHKVVDSKISQQSRRRNRRDDRADNNRLLISTFQVCKVQSLLCDQTRLAQQPDHPCSSHLTSCQPGSYRH